MRAVRSESSPPTSGKRTLAIVVGIIVLIAIAVVAYMALYGGGSSGGATTGGTGGGAGGGYFALALTAEQLRRVKQHIKRHR